MSFFSFSPPSLHGEAIEISRLRQPYQAFLGSTRTFALVTDAFSPTVQRSHQS